MVRKVGPYRILRTVGRGGLGVVYRALDSTGREVALKLLNRPAADAVAARRLVREFQALSTIEHRNIVRVLDAGVHDDTPFLAMELVEGLSLRAYLSGALDAAFTPRPPPPPLDDPSGPRGGSRSGEVPAWMLADDEPDSVPGPLRRRGGRGAPVPVAVLPPEDRALLNQAGRLARLRDVVAQLCDGLAFIHARGLVHRDVKPSNVLVADGGCAKLVDFGLVKLTASSGHTTATGHVVGTYRYMSPEQAQGGRVDGRSDLYALGGLLYEMLCGHPPFLQQQPSELLRAIVSQPPPAPELFNPEIDPLLAHVATKLLQKAPQDRYQTADEVARRLRSAGGRG